MRPSPDSSAAHAVTHATNGIALRRLGTPSDDEPIAVFLHGMGCSSTIWGIRKPVPGRAIVLVDLPGHGQSRVEAPTTLTEMAALVREALDEVGVGSTMLVGHSLGGLVALHLEPLLGERNRLTALASTGVAFQVSESADLYERGELDRVRRVIVAQLFGPLIPDLYRRVAAAGMRQVPDSTVRRCLDALVRFDVRALPRPSDRPRAMIQGSRDAVVDCEAARALRDLLGSDYEEIEGAGHMLMLEAAHEFADGGRPS